MAPRLVQGRDGNFYGTTNGGRGTVIKIAPEGALSVLHTFSERHASGFLPLGGLALGRDGNFYGITNMGGSSGGGTVFKITPSGAFKTLHSFQDNEGRLPEARLIQGRDGNFYGTTLAGGSAGKGTVFKVSPAGLLTTLHQFSGPDDDYF